jgi:selenocysteine lyase/cysteine desulfurase
MHNQFFEELRAREYSRIDDEQHVYLDYTGGNLYADSQINQHFAFLKTHTFGNPHSSNPTSQLSNKLVEEARKKVIDFFNAEDYFCVFTANASGALKIIGECYPFAQDGHFLLLADNHNSVNGIREYCKSSGGSFQYSPMRVEDLNIAEDTLETNLQIEGKQNKLFAFPAQSNVSGVKHDLNWIKKAQNLGWDVLLDAAAFVPTSTLDLKKHTPDYVSISFYKIFGYPTGLGCLLIRKSAFEKLNKKWFAGGTVKLAAVSAPFHFLIENHERFENGTLNYLDIPAIKIGLDYIDSIGMGRINQRVSSLMSYLHAQLKELKHSNGNKQLDIFGHPQRERMGGTMIMCFKNPDGSKIGFERIEELANQQNISLRSGCFCNPGLDETNNCLTTDELTKYFEGRTTGTYDEMIKSLNKMRGATRISVGIATNKNDLDRFIGFVGSLKDQFVEPKIIT